MKREKRTYRVIVETRRRRIVERVVAVLCELAIQVLAAVLAALICHALGV